MSKWSDEFIASYKSTKKVRDLTKECKKKLDLPKYKTKTGKL